MNPKLRRWLHKRAENPQQNLALLGIGFATFFVGVVVLGSAEYAMSSSLLQELVALIGLIIIALGLILAATGYLSLSVLRLLRMMLKDKDD